MSVEKLPVCVVIPVKNEAHNLSASLAALGRFAEILVVDSDSTDATQDIAKSFGARVLNFVWDGRYPKKRNWVLLNHAPAQPFVLFLDADEIVNDAFCNALARALAADTCDGYWLNYTVYFLGRKLRFGVPQRKLALFRTGHALYERIDETSWSALDMEVHEHPVLTGRAGEIAERIDHRDLAGLEKFNARHDDYALWEARRYLALHRSGDAAWAALTPRQKLKYRYLTQVWYAPAYFLYHCVVRLGALDGAAGLRYGWAKAVYFAKIRSLIRRFRQGAA